MFQSVDDVCVYYYILLLCHLAETLLWKAHANQKTHGVNET